MRISVCIPTVRPTTLAQAVRSILEQTFQDWELVVIGQGDEAQLRAATERGAKGDSRVRYLHITRTRGRASPATRERRRRRAS